MDNTILFIMLVAIALFMITAYVLINVRLAELKKSNKALKILLTANEEHLREVYEIYKHPEPQIAKSSFIIQDFYTGITIPDDRDEFISFDEIVAELSRGLARNIKQFIEVKVERDIRMRETRYKGRIKLVIPTTNKTGGSSIGK